MHKIVSGGIKAGVQHDKHHLLEMHKRVRSLILAFILNL